MGIETTTIPRRYVYYQADAPTGVNNGDIWIDSDTDLSYFYSSSAWVAINQDSSARLSTIMAPLAIDVLRCLAHFSSTPSDYDILYADTFSDSSGYSNTIDTGASTTASFVTDNYSNAGTGLTASAYWKFNESSGNATDSSGNSLTLTNNGTTTYGTGKLQNACNVTTGKYFSSTAVGALGTGDFTMAFWIKTTASGSYNYIASCGVDSNNNSFELYSNGSGYLIWRDPNANVKWSSDVAINNDAWRHVVITRISGAVKVFIDGTEDVSARATDNTDYSNNTAFCIGKATSANYITASIDNFILVIGTGWLQASIDTDYNSGSGNEYLNLGSNKVVVTNTLTMDDNLTAYQVYSKHTDNGSGTLTYQISFDNGSTYQTAQALDSKISNDVTGTSIKIKFLLNGTGAGNYEQMYNYALLVWY